MRSFLAGMMSLWSHFCGTGRATLAADEHSSTQITQSVFHPFLSAFICVRLRPKSPPAIQAKENIEDRHEHVEEPGKKDERAGDGAVRVGIVEDVAGGVD